MSQSKIQVSYVYPPIPSRRFDWCAYIDGHEETNLYGWGASKLDALKELGAMIEDQYNSPEVDFPGVLAEIENRITGLLKPEESAQ